MPALYLIPPAKETVPLVVGRKPKTKPTPVLLVFPLIVHPLNCCLGTRRSRKIFAVAEKHMSGLPAL